jgi:hypothetical protein
MATVYTIGATAADLAPFSQQWVQVPIGIDFDQNTIFAGNEEIVLKFDSASITMARQWLEAASSGSTNLTVLNRFGLDWTDLSAIHLHVQQYPEIMSGHSGPFTIVVRGASSV